MKLSLKTAMLLGCALCAVFLFCAYKLRSSPSTEFDEGVYLTTFESVQNGFPLYQATYFSQPPGFFLTTFPIYALLGSTLQAARLAVFAYSLIGLLALIWIGWEVDSVVFSFIAIGVLYLIPIYTIQIMTFHADSLPSAFSALAIAAMLRFRNTSQRRWIVVSALMIALAVLIKVDVSALAAVGLVLIVTALREKPRLKELMKSAGIFAPGLLAALGLFTVPFGLKNIVSNVINLRIQAATSSAFDPNLFLSFLKEQDPLIALMALGVGLNLIAVLRNKAARFPVLILFSWLASTVAMLLLYHPLMPHHLVFLALPTAAFFAFGVYQIVRGSRFSTVLRIGVPILLLVVVVSRVQYALTPEGGVATQDEMRALRLVQMDTKPGDYVISDDGMITGLANRPTPPDLTDLSAVRISTGLLSSQAFRISLATYRPKLVLAWNYRLIFLPNFDKIMQKHHYVLLKSGNPEQETYIRQN